MKELFDKQAAANGKEAKVQIARWVSIRSISLAADSWIGHFTVGPGDGRNLPTTIIQLLPDAMKEAVKLVARH